MVDVDRRTQTLFAALRRLSARAATSTALPPRHSLFSFTPLAEKLITHVKQSNIQVQSGLSESEFAFAEAEFGFVFPPDLRAVLSAGLPLGAGFPDWLATGAARHLLRACMELPSASVAFHVARNDFWSKSWGPRPHDPRKAMQIARNWIKRAPVLIPVFERCYVPCNPCLAGNPVFYVDESRIFCCGFDLSDFFDREKSGFNRSSDPGRITGQRSEPGVSRRRSLDIGTSRWIEFWSDAAAVVDRRGRNSNSISSNSPKRVPRSECPEWVDEYMGRIGSVLKEGGWGESDVDEVVHVSGRGFFHKEMVMLDEQGVMDALLVKADRVSDTLQKGGWSSEEVSDVLLGFDFGRVKEKKPGKRMSKEFVERIGKLAELVNRSSDTSSL